MENMDGELVFTKLDTGVGLVKLNRPEKLNALNANLMKRLVQVFTETKYGGDVNCLVITGEGKAFSAGHDLDEPEDETAPNGTDLYSSAYNCEVPMIAAVRGWAVGAAAGICLCSTIRLAAPSAKFMWPQVKSGHHGITGPSILSRLIPQNIALEMTLTGKPFLAENAFRAGLINRIVEEDALLEEALALGADIASHDPSAVRQIRATIRECEDKPFSDRLDVAMRANRFLEKEHEGEERLPIRRQPV